MRATAYEVMTTCAPAMVSSSPRPALLRVRSTTTVRSDGANRAASLSQVDSTEVGRHDEHRVVELAALVRPQHHREHLQRLAQAHVVGEHPAEPAVPQQRQPAEAVDLVGPQRRVEPRGQLGRLDGVEVEQRPDGTAPPVGLLLDDPEGGELLPQPGVHHRDAQRVGGLVLQRAGLVDQRPQRLELGPVEREPGAAVEDEVLVAARDAPR